MKVPIPATPLPQSAVRLVETRDFRALSKRRVPDIEAD